MLTKKVKPIVVWENPGTADLWTRAANDDHWLALVPGTGVLGRDTYVPGSTVQDVGGSMDATEANPTLGAANWYTLDTEECDYILFEIKSKLISFTGVAAPQVEFSKFRMACQHVITIDNDDDDFSYPAQAALGILDGLSATPGGQAIQTQSCGGLPLDSEQGQNYTPWIGLHGDVNLLNNGRSFVQVGTDLSSGSAKRMANSWRVYGRPWSTAALAPSGTGYIIPNLKTDKWARICFQLFGGMKGLAANLPDTLRFKAQVTAKLVWEY